MHVLDENDRLLLQAFKTAATTPHTSDSFARLAHGCGFVQHVKCESEVFIHFPSTRLCSSLAMLTLLEYFQIIPRAPHSKTQSSICDAGLPCDPVDLTCVALLLFPDAFQGIADESGAACELQRLTGSGSFSMESSVVSGTSPSASSTGEATVGFVNVVNASREDVQRWNRERYQLTATILSSIDESYRRGQAILVSLEHQKKLRKDAGNSKQPVAVAVVEQAMKQLLWGKLLLISCMLATELVATSTGELDGNHQVHALVRQWLTRPPHAPAWTSALQQWGWNSTKLVDAESLFDAIASDLKNHVPPSLEGVLLRSAPTATSSAKATAQPHALAQSAVPSFTAGGFGLLHRPLWWHAAQSHVPHDYCSTVLTHASLLNLTRVLTPNILTSVSDLKWLVPVDDQLSAVSGSGLPLLFDDSDTSLTVLLNQCSKSRLTLAQARQLNSILDDVMAATADGVIPTPPFIRGRRAAVERFVLNSNNLVEVGDKNKEVFLRLWQLFADADSQFRETLRSALLAMAIGEPVCAIVRSLVLDHHEMLTFDELSDWISSSIRQVDRHVLADAGSASRASSRAITLLSMLLQNIWLQKKRSVVRSEVEAELLAFCVAHAQCNELYATLMKLRQ